MLGGHLSKVPEELLVDVIECVPQALYERLLTGGCLGNVRTHFIDVLTQLCHVHPPRVRSESPVNIKSQSRVRPRKRRKIRSVHRLVDATPDELRLKYVTYPG
jgi:hypothetical protein